MSNTQKDPVCGMTVQPQRGLTVSYNEQTVYFCSEYCRNKFLERPEKYFAALMAPSYDEAKEHRRIAYFSMEVAVGPGMPNYAGGLGVLAGDTLKSCADLRVPLVGVSLLSRKGYFDQHLDEWGHQQERPVEWQPEHFLRPLPETVTVEIEQRTVRVRAWQYDIAGLNGYVVPLILLDTDVEGNTGYDRTLTGFLYGGDDRYRLAQEIVLGIGGVRMLHALGYSGIQKFHMNEGHASLLLLELLLRSHGESSAEWDFEGVRRQCVFTTHTPVPAGHDQFDYDLVQRVLGPVVPFDVLHMLSGEDGLNMTLLGLNLSHYVNGVANKRADLILSDVSRLIEIAKQVGPLQFVFAGKAHPKDYAGKELIKRIIDVSRQVRDQIDIVYLENYDLELAKRLVSGVDLWLNTPQRPLEASGTSGMKAAHNGVPSFSTLDGWWIEGHLEGLTGWSIGSRDTGQIASEAVNWQDADDLYQKLKNVIVPLFYRHREQWIEVMRHAIALNASYFNTHRMVQQYVTNAYLA
ncbi:MAG: alpha-glucan family phosphorylase [Acidobacteria bacterium]|nr:alpha-glucan family phosphorylase [Acidobacteriota bacterium]